MASIKQAIKSTVAENVVFKPAFRLLEKDPVKNFPKLLDWADKFTKGNQYNTTVNNFRGWWEKQTWQGQLMKRILETVNVQYLKKFVLNYFLNTGVKINILKALCDSKVSKNLLGKILLISKITPANLGKYGLFLLFLPLYRALKPFGIGRFNVKRNRVFLTKVVTELSVGFGCHDK